MAAGATQAPPGAEPGVETGSEIETGAGATEAGDS